MTAQRSIVICGGAFVGLALALARNNKYAEAEKELSLAIKAGESPMLLNLRA